MKKKIQVITLLLGVLFLLILHIDKAHFYRQFQISLMKQSFIENSKVICYEPENWEKFSKKTNCFTYALNMKNRFDSKVVGTMGNFKDIFLSSSLSLSEAITLEKEKLDVLNIEYRSSYFEEEVPDGYYKVIFFITTKDFHWVRQDEDGTWSHKLGWYLSPTNLDMDGNIILNPETANLGITGDILYAEYLLIKKVP